jgi:hypothetical protein
MASKLRNTTGISSLDWANKDKVFLIEFCVISARWASDNQKGERRASPSRARGGGGAARSEARSVPPHRERGGSPWTFG